ncbi:MAG: SRPBCC domain-containing protein [Acidimicrobiales bacterium]|nr:SRPBCC domain-containing protein [Acidimicrobiales bacterium]
MPDSTSPDPTAEPSSSSGPARNIELEVEVAGTPEEVWRAIATGPGISSWYVPHTVEEREGGAAMASFGPGPEMQIPGRVAAWEPPHRIVFDGGEDAGGLAFEWLVEARDGGTCIVRLVNSGFGSGEPWDDQYDGMAEGWLLFLRNLQLHCEHFRGQSATAVLPMAMWPGPRAATWAALCDGLGLPASPSVGDRVAVTSPDAPPLGGTVLDAESWRLALLLDEPAAGTAFLAAEGDGDEVGVSVWSYLYGEAGAAAAARDEPRWWSWLGERAAAPPTAG